MENFKAVVMKWNVFTGRAGRREFWMFVLFNILISLVLGIIDSITGLKIDDKGILSTIFSLLMIAPSLSVGARRLHDTNKTGWWQLLGIIPVIGWIVLIIFFVKDSNPGENKYGPSPKMVASPAAVSAAPVTPTT